MDTTLLVPSFILALMGIIEQLNKVKVPSVKSFCILMRGFSREMNKASYSFTTIIAQNFYYHVILNFRIFIIP